MIKTEELQDLIKTVLYTGYISGEKPLSVLLIGQVGIGKSQLITDYEKKDNIVVCSDITYMGILHHLKTNREFRHLIIPDFLKITMKSKTTTANAVSILNAGIEEGIGEINLLNYNEDFKGKTFGLITATTKDSLSQNRKNWQSMGFLSRCLIISYDYKDDTKEQIFDFIQDRLYKSEKKKELDLPSANLDVILPKELAKKLRNRETTFRSQKQLQTLAMARAIMNNLATNKFIVTQKEIDEVLKMSKFFNYNFTKI